MAEGYLCNFAILCIIGLSTLLVPLESARWGYLKLFLKYNSPPIFNKSVEIIKTRAIQLKLAFHGRITDTKASNTIFHSVPYNGKDQNVQRSLMSVKINEHKFDRILMSDFFAQCMVVNDENQPTYEYVAKIPHISEMYDTLFRHVGQTFKLTFKGGCKWTFELSTVCDDDWYGLNCNIKCHSDLKRIARCLRNGSKVCRPGFSGVDCADINECNGPDPCRVYRNSTVCHNTIGSFTCICGPGLVTTITGCQDINECVKFQNKVCVRGTCVNVPGSFKCICPLQYNGVLCEHDINECAHPNACKNGGTCYNSHGNFKCVCPLYSAGIYCQIVFDPCRDFHCGDRGTCKAVGPRWSCDCRDGLYGPTCKKVSASVQCKKNNPCKNGGECRGFNLLAPKCYCSPLFIGDFCQLPNPYAKPAISPLRAMEKRSAAPIGMVQTLFITIFFTSLGAVLSIVYSKARKTVKVSMTMNPLQNSNEANAQ